MLNLLILNCGCFKLHALCPMYLGTMNQLPMYSRHRSLTTKTKVSLLRNILCTIFWKAAFKTLKKRPSAKMVKHTQTIRRQKPTNCFSVFDHFVGLALKELILTVILKRCTCIYWTILSMSGASPITKRHNLNLKITLCAQWDRLTLKGVLKR